MADDVHDQRQAEQDESGPDGCEPVCLPRNANRAAARATRSGARRPATPARARAAASRYRGRGTRRRRPAPARRLGRSGFARPRPSRRRLRWRRRPWRERAVAPLVRRVEEAVAQIGTRGNQTSWVTNRVDRSCAGSCERARRLTPRVRGAPRSGPTPRRACGSGSSGARDDAPICSLQSGSTPRACGRCSTGGTSPSARSPRASSLTRVRVPSAVSRRISCSRLVRTATASLTGCDDAFGRVG